MISFPALALKVSCPWKRLVPGKQGWLATPGFSQSPQWVSSSGPVLSRSLSRWVHSFPLCFSMPQRGDVRQWYCGASSSWPHGPAATWGQHLLLTKHMHQCAGLKNPRKPPAPQPNLPPPTFTAAPTPTSSHGGQDGSSGPSSCLQGSCSAYRHPLTSDSMREVQARKGVGTHPCPGQGGGRFLHRSPCAALGGQE